VIIVVAIEFEEGAKELEQTKARSHDQQTVILDKSGENLLLEFKHKG
jgi:hypothetical protein